MTVANFTGEREEFTLLELEEPALAELFAESCLPAGTFQVTPEIDFAIGCCCVRSAAAVTKR